MTTEPHRPLPRRVGWYARVAAVAIALSLLGSAGSAFSQDADATVDMVGLKFVPVAVHVAPGSTIEWTNSSDVGHTVTADDGSFDSGDVEPGETFTWTFDDPGTYQYYCEPHGAPGLRGMAATIVVDDPNAESPLP